MWRGPLAYGQATADRTWVMVGILGGRAVTVRTGFRATDGQPAARALEVMRFGPQPHDFAAEVCGL